jgi:hypothetical protein
MPWFLATSDMPGRPFAVIDGEGLLAGCHSTREAASLQMVTLNQHGLEPAQPEPPKPAPKPDGPTVREPPPPPPVMYSMPATVGW